MSACSECGFRLALDGGYDESGFAGAGADIRLGCSEASSLLRTTDGSQLRRRPTPGTWSPLEYACHVRDVLLVQRERVLAALRDHGDETRPMGRDERVDHDGYNQQDPEDVAIQLEQAAVLFSGLLDRLGPGDWDRELLYNFPVSRTRTLRWVAVHTSHEVTHHLADIRRER